MSFSCLGVVFFFFFFFSSRRRHTRCYRDWSSDVCSSDLGSRSNASASTVSGPRLTTVSSCGDSRTRSTSTLSLASGSCRSEERRVGKECRYRGSQHGEKKKHETTDEDGPD